MLINQTSQNRSHLFSMEDIKNSIASRWQKQPLLKTIFFTSVLQMKSSSICLIPASLCEGPIFNFYVELTYSLLSQASIWVVMFHSFIYWSVLSCLLSSLFCTMLLSEGISLWKLSMIAKSLFRWAYGFCYISSILKKLHSKASIVCSLFSDQELRFAITNYSLLCASLFVIPYYLLQVYIL
jgi:hypothetical protein